MIDKHCFDMEYSTQNRKEVEFLKQYNIYYTFVKKENNISLYKYTKNKKLFEVLSLFYNR